MKSSWWNLSSSTTVLVHGNTDKNPEGTKCGLFFFYPSFLQRFATPRSFLVCFCLKNILQGMVFTYLVGIETSLERHFQFDGKTIGLLLTLGEIGPILTAVWISHMGSRGNRPRWMAAGMMLVALGLFLSFCMYLIFPPAGLAMREVGESFTQEMSAARRTCQVNPNNGNWSDLKTLMPEWRCTIDSDRRLRAFAAWVIVYSIVGIGGTTVYTIGAPYLDDSVSDKQSPMYFGITIAVRIIGPVFGYMLSSACLQLYVDPGQKPNLKSDDPRWIGAWWLGALIMAFLIFIFALVLGSFPRMMKKKCDEKEKSTRNTPNSRADSLTSTCTIVTRSDTTSTFQEETPDTAGHASDFKSAIIRLLRNPILICSCGSSVFTILGLAGYFIWLPKFFEHEFRISKSKSAMYSGLSGNVTMIVGVLLSGYMMQKFKPSARFVAALVAATKYVYALGLLIVMVVGTCNFNTDLPGVLDSNGSLVLTQNCNQACACNTTEFIPICLRSESKEQTYFSPCHAGCTEVISINQTALYSSCRCDPEARVKTGFCNEETCSNLYVYMVLLSIIKLAVSFSAVGNLIIDLRCVEERDKALGLGLIAAVSGLLGFLPNPIIYGALIDSSCLVWESSCGHTGSCWIYDVEGFRYKLHGLTSGFLFVAGIFETVTYLKVKNLKLFQNEQ